MNEILKKRFEFPSSLIQAQAVRSLVAAVLKEKSQNKISESTTRGPALDALWEQCDSESGVVRSACCSALVLLVEQDHADLQHVLNSILNMLPSARNVQGLIKVVGRLLQIQASQRDQKIPFACPYSIRVCPHPYITVLENRPDCWPALLQEIDDFIQLATDKDEPLYISMLAPFLRYLYCEPQRLPENALLRHGLLRVLLQPRDPAHALLPAPQSKAPPLTPVAHEILCCLIHLFPHMLVDSVTDLVELCSLAESLSVALLADPERWKAELAQLALQLLCACQLSLRLGGELRSLLHTLHLLLPVCREDLPSEQVLMGISLLLLRASALQQNALLELVVKIVPAEGPPPWGASLLLMPLLHVLSCSTLMEALMEPQIQARSQELATSLLQSIQAQPSSPVQNPTRLPLPLSPWYSELQASSAVLHRFSTHPTASAEWLHSVRSSLPPSERLPDALAVLVSHLVVGSEGELCRLALDVAAAVAESDPAQVPCLLPVLLFKLERVSDPALSHAILSTIPKLGTHKFCIPQVLRVLQTLAASPKLRAVALRLLTALWQKQDRVYPELQKVMAVLEKSSVVVGKEAQWEQIVARAACIRDICRERPYQHGGDMLADIAATLTQCSRGDQATAAALALQGLQDLCRAEVVDIGSTWRALSPRLSCETRPLVLKATAELLSLVPSLQVSTEQYENFKSEVVSFLWSHALSQDTEVSSSGYRALSEFPESSHSVLHLPQQARPERKEPDPQDDEDKENEQDEDLTVPGASYVKLVGLTPRPVLPALETFLTALVRQEMNQMPRGVYHSAMRGGNLRSDQGKTIAGIPSFMLKTYEKNKQPGLKPGLAAGLLLCYDLPVQTDRDGRPIIRFMVSRGRSFQQMLTTFIHEVNIQPSEWHRSLLLPQAWRGFMSRAYHAVLQGRNAELEMLQKQGKTTPDELQYKQHCAWLWVRDQLTDVVKAAAKDSPVVQGNCVLALSGLAVALSRYQSSLPASSDGGVEVGPEILPTAHWLSMVIDTLLSIVSSSSRPGGQVFPWFVHRSYSGENTASAIARSCAALGLAMLSPVLVTTHREATPTVLGVLRAGLPSSPAAEDSQALQFHSGLALGLLTARLLEERVGDIAGQPVYNVVLSSLEVLESCCFNTQLEYNAGCVLAVGLLLGALCSSSEVEQRRRGALSLEKLLQTLRDSIGGTTGRMQQEVLGYSVACSGVSAFSSGAVDGDRAEEVMNTLRSMTEESQQTPGFALALGLLVHGLSSCGHGKAVDIHPRLLSAWTKILLAEGCPTTQRLAALNGLIALVGSETALFQLKSQSEQSSQDQARLNDVIRSITQIISFSGATGLQSNGASLLGHLYLAHLSSRHSSTAVPQDFSYLPEKSVVRASTDCIIEAGRKGPEVFPPGLIKVVLAPLATVGASFQYPPVNWNSILSPLMRLNFGEEVQHHCLELAVSQVQSSPSASLFLGVWLAPPLVHSLRLRTRVLLYERLCSWMKHVAEDKLQVHVESLAVQQFLPGTRAQQLPLCRAVLTGLAKAMALPDPARSCWTTLCSTTEKIFNHLPDGIQVDEVELYEGICSCLSEMSDTEIDRIVKVTEANVEKTAFVLSYLSSKGRIPLLGLNDVISTILQASKSEKRMQISWLLLQCFHQSRLASSPNTGVSKRMDWLLELMGHIRNVAYGAPTVKCNNTKEATDFLLGVFAAALASWADHSMPLLVGARAQWFPWKQSPMEHLDQPDGLYMTAAIAEESVKQCLLGLPHSLKELLTKDPWKAQSQKVTDWLFSLAEAPEESLSQTAIFTARASLLALRSTPEFKKKAVWTRAYGW
ncbi:focadhesin [Brachyhypopomus gauderio]|uniref:focadhesin n=1 Tax=Brachyhypopomus gauderio TaxID=698409 RepID=UPI004042DDC5